MTHEIKNLVGIIWKAQQQGIKSVLATVVDLEGSSYRRPGVRMLIQENGQTHGVISGGCVEKEVERQAQFVLKMDIPKMMIYDGRFRLGCEGIIYILIEPVKITQDMKSQNLVQLDIARKYLTLHPSIPIDAHLNLLSSENSCVQLHGLLH